jgi:Carboxypeptidase regulatory-like domain
MSLQRERLILSSSLLGVYLLCVSALHAQTGRMFEGNVQDQTGGFIAGADVTLFSDDRVLTTKTNENGIFRFSTLPPRPRYVEVSSPGFVSRSIAIADQSPERISFTLWIFDSGPHVTVTECSPLIECGPARECGPTDNVLPPSASYEERSGNIQLTGTVTDLSRVSLRFTSITLSQADLDTPVRDRPQGIAMRERFLKESVVAEVVSNDRGEFQFTDLEPGWYTLKATLDGYSNASVKFWVAHQNLTKLSRLYLFPVPPNCR